MYSLIVTAAEEAWDEDRYSMHLSRFGEYTAEGTRARFWPLDEKAVERLKNIPALFAYEQMHDLPARVGVVTEIKRGFQGDIRFKFKLSPRVSPISQEQLVDLAWDLDIADWEFNRTHWAIKDIDLVGVLREAGLIPSTAGRKGPSRTEVSPEAVRTNDGPGARNELVVRPEAFAVPKGGQDPRLVSVMMPFAAEFEAVYQAVEGACGEVGLHCRRAKDIWEASTIIQDIFALIYRSSAVVVDLTGRNANVLYETGIAHTLGRPVVPIAQSVGDLPFDLAHHRTLQYLPNEEGLAEMKDKIGRKLRHLLL